MSISCDAALRLLDDSLNFLTDSSVKLRAGTLVDESRTIEHLKKASESARIVREAVLSELPDASWQNREELDALVERIRIISEQRPAAQRRRSRLLALRTALESGSIVHRRAQRLAELRQLRDHAIDKLRSQAALESPTSDLPGPEADRWIEWACDLKEPKDTELLQSIRAAFPHLDNFIANLEPSMWTAGSSGATIQLGAEQATAKEESEEPRRHIEEREDLVPPDVADGNQKGAEEALQRSKERVFARFTSRIVEEHRQTGPISADASTEMATPTRGAAVAADHTIDKAVQKLLPGRRWILLAGVPPLLLAAGFLMWRGSRNTGSNRTLDPVQRTLPAQSQSNPPEVSTSTATPSEHEARVAAPASLKEQIKDHDHSLARDSSAKGQAAKPAGGHDADLLRPTLSIPGQEESASAAGSDTQVPLAGGSINGVPTGMTNVLTTVPVVVPQLAPQKDQASSGTVAAVLLKEVPPRYPLQARQARVEGTVVLEGIIGIDGKLQNLRAVRGDARLVQAAIDAAKQWRYKPSLLHGQPAESVTQITVNFSLTGR